MNTQNHFSDRLETIYRGEPWFGESFQMKLKDLSEADAFHQPKPENHSIAEVVNHMEYWRRAFVYRLKGDNSVAFTGESSENWRTLEALKKVGWKKLLSEFEATHDALLGALANSKAIDPALAADLNGLIDHDIYHLGQIGLIKKLITIEN